MLQRLQQHPASQALLASPPLLICRSSACTLHAERLSGAIRHISLSRLPAIQLLLGYTSFRIATFSMTVLHATDLCHSIAMLTLFEPMPPLYRYRCCLA